MKVCQALDRYAVPGLTILLCYDHFARCESNPAKIRPRKQLPIANQSVAADRDRFLVKGQPGQKSPRKLDNVRAWDGKTHLDFLVAAEAGEFTVASGGWPWWLIALLALLAIVILLFLIKARGRARS
jgi:hypothetical protein